MIKRVCFCFACIFIMLLPRCTAEKANLFNKRNNQFLIHAWLNPCLEFSGSVSEPLRNLFLSWTSCSRVFDRQMFAVLCYPFLPEF